MVRLILYNLLLFSACGYAFWRGRIDARIVAAFFFIGSFATFALRSHIASEYSSVEPAVLIIDVICFLAFAYAALISDRFWPLWVSGLQLTTSFGHVLKAIDASILPLAYAASLRFWGYPILIILAIGVWRGQQRLRRERELTAT